jgi:DMSO/TMAO reductase YedYZ heme-binding membrane subunit
MFTAVMSVIGTIAAVIVALALLFVAVEGATLGMEVVTSFYNRIGYSGVLILTCMLALTLMVGWQTTVVSAIVMTVSFCLDHLTRPVVAAAPVAAAAV